MSAWADQIAAAKRETTQVHALLGLVCNAKQGHHAGVQQWVERWRRSIPLQPGCRHARSPVTLIGVLAHPPVVYCPRCALAAVQSAVQSDPDHCDGCGNKARTFHEVALQAGDVLHLFGHVCPSCFGEIRQVTP